jgi:chromosome segregation ATPase
MREFDMSMHEKTDRLNHLTLANEELERCVAEKDRINEKLCEQMRDLDERLEVSSKLKIEHEATLAQYKQDVDELLKSSKAQSALVNELKEQANIYKSKCEDQMRLLESWAVERDDLTQQKVDIQTELYSYMTRFSELQIHKENLEMELRSQIKAHEEKLRSANVLLEEKEVEIGTLQERINELNEDLQRRIESEINHLKYFNKEEESLLKTYEEEIDQLKIENDKLKVRVN